MLSCKSLLSSSSRRLVRLSSTTAPAHPAKSAVPSYSIESAVTDLPQAPNAAQPWSTSQRPRPNVNTGPRFEQTAMQLQPNPLSAMEMIQNEPIRLSHSRIAACDGGSRLLISRHGFTQLCCRWRSPWTPENLHQLGTHYNSTSLNVCSFCYV